MPAILLRFLPHLLVIVAIIGAVWWINDAGYDRAMSDRDAADAKMLSQIRTEQRRSEQRLAIAINAIDAAVASQIAGIDATHTETRRVIEREIIREPRLSDPAAGLTDGLFDAINRERAAIACAPTPAGGVSCTLPPAQPIDE